MSTLWSRKEDTRANAKARRCTPWWNSGASVTSRQCVNLPGGLSLIFHQLLMQINRSCRDDKLSNTVLQHDMAIYCIKLLLKVQHRSEEPKLPSTPSLINKLVCISRLPFDLRNGNFMSLWLSCILYDCYSTQRPMYEIIFKRCVLKLFITSLR